MPRPLCSDQENILRAINLAHWDPNHNRGNSSLFRGSNLSVSRLAILPQDEILQIFKSELVCPVLFAGEINVGALKGIGRSHSTIITVEEDPLPTNLAHAEIPENLTSKKLARDICGALLLHKVA